MVFQRATFKYFEVYLKYVAQHSDILNYLRYYARILPALVHEGRGWAIIHVLE